MGDTDWTLTVRGMPNAIEELRLRFTTLLRRVREAGYKGINEPALAFFLIERGLLSCETELAIELRDRAGY